MILVLVAKSTRPIKSKTRHIFSSDVVLLYNLAKRAIAKKNYFNKARTAKNQT